MMLRLPASLTVSTRTLVYGVIAGLMTFELFWAAWVLWGPKKKEVVKVNPALVTFALSPERNTYSVGEPFEVSLQVHTNGRSISGVDVSLQYDTRVLRVEPKNSKAPVYATASALFDSYPTNKVNKSVGQIELSAVKFAGRSFNGSGEVGKVRFVPLTSGKIEVKFRYNPGNTTDSNAADSESGKDILGQAVGGIYEIR